MLLAASTSALEPDEILVIASGADHDSVQTAKYYCQKRNVPIQNLVKLPLPIENPERISRTDYQYFIEKPIRQILSTDEFAGKIKCLLIVYGVPFKVGPSNPSIAETGLLRQLQKLSQTKLSQIRLIAQQVEKVSTTTGQKEKQNDYNNMSPVKLLRQLPDTFEKKRFQLKKHSDKTKQTGQLKELLPMYQKVYGPANTAQYAAKIDGTAFELTSLEKVTLNENIRYLNRAQQEKWTLEKKLDSDYFNRLEAVAGLAKVLDHLITNIDRINGVETNASLDSELSMVMFDGYELYRWQPNELKQRILWVGTKTMMVSRLDGPGHNIAKALVDKAIAAEQKGLEGNAYFDSRFGSDNKMSSQYAEYDRSIQKAAEILRQKTDLNVVEEQTSTLFQPGDCPDTAIYCGWYSLKTYVDAFDFKTGAVGYHIASFEATDLRNPKSKQWCPAMLADGITATIGPVAEPYLHAFPKPQLFFAELIKGKCLAEAYYKTKPFNSWQMLLIGDPLYKPFKTN